MSVCEEMYRLLEGAKPELIIYDTKGKVTQGRSSGYIYTYAQTTAGNYAWEVTTTTGVMADHGESNSAAAAKKAAIKFARSQ